MWFDVKSLTFWRRSFFWMVGFLILWIGAFAYGMRSWGTWAAQPSSAQPSAVVCPAPPKPAFEFALSETVGGNMLKEVPIERIKAPGRTFCRLYEPGETMALESTSDRLPVARGLSLVVTDPTTGISWRFCTAILEGDTPGDSPAPPQGPKALPPGGHGPMQGI